MSSPATPSKTGATFLWVLGAFASFAVLFLLIQALVGKPSYEDPRAEGRSASREEVVKAQSELVAKMGLNDAAKKEAIFNSTVAALQGKKPAASIQVVPGSPTQLKQAAAAAATPAPAPAPGATPATPAAPASAK